MYYENVFSRDYVVSWTKTYKVENIYKVSFK